ncbi:AprI/Inh family metalloprotease inhibitor [Labrys wisconsinensis]|uniref:Alkaline proteinase inhibitor/ Outer membrane lipoprotein Omp19 domain-containing protein n=1 Tax=Labrys wisconsinensis TaxID=425677 RepID=A0ABU0J1S9_9HYPH|nr:AprI/Inh family metalloprotease inhibitor [Labrys wisconsinensis]MDQ0468202.1 hypothetical protein [Labrys wisconsinensis]
MTQRPAGGSRQARRPRPGAALCLLVPAALALAGCESTSRFDGGLFGSRPAPVAAARPIEPEPAIAAPTAPVTSEALPPVTGSVDPNAPGAPLPGSPPPGGSQVATLPDAAAPPAGAPSSPAPAPTPTRPSARAMVGTWKISDAARGSCAIALTQQTLLDLYRASPSGCQASSLAKVNAWQQRGQEIVLLESGGRTAVRLFPKGDGTYEGAATTSGAIIRMSR